MQRYVNKYDSLQHLDVEKVIACTKSYSQTQLLHYLKNKFGASYAIVAEQVELHAKARQKLPQWVNAGCLFTRRSLEQCSSRAMATYKAQLMEGKTLVDLCGGLGVDDAAFSTRFTRVISVDQDEALNDLARYNFNKLFISNITRITSTAEAYLDKLTEPVDAFYLDADRRTEEGRKVVTLHDSSPDVAGLMPQLLEKASRVLLKLSPMIDLQAVINGLPGVKELFVTGTRNEVKEVLALLYKGPGRPVILAAELDASGNELHVFSAQAPENNSVPSNPGTTYFYEPSNMLIKAGLTADYARATGAELVHRNSHYMMSGALIDPYFGRSFAVLHHHIFSKSWLKAYLKEQGIRKANISARNFVATVEEIRKTFGIEDGGDDYLFFSTDAGRNKLFWHCRKL